MLGAALLCGCTSPVGGSEAESASEAEASEEEAKLDVEVMSPEVKDISISSNFAGTVVAQSEVYVIPMISGEVVEKNYEVGDHVNEGDLLFKIDDEALQIALTQAEANVTSAQAGLSAQKAAAEATKASSNATRAQATQTVGEIPYNAEAMNVNVDSAYATKRSANNSLKSAWASIDHMEDQLDDLEDARDAAESATATAKAAYEELLAKGASEADIAAALKTYTTAESTVSELDSSIDTLELNIKTSKYSADSAEMQYDVATENYNLSQMKRNNYNTYTVPTTLYGAYASAVGANASDVGADAQVTSSAATVKQAQAGLDSAKLQLEYTNVKAPVSGTITSIGVTLHNMATQSSAAYTIQSDDPNKIVFYAAEETAKNIRSGSDAIVTKNGVDYKAKILTVYDTIDATTGLFKIEASVTDRAAASDLISGSSVSIKTVTRRTGNALSVPIDAVYYDGDQAYVYVNDNGTAKRVDVTPGLSDDQSIEIAEGLTGNEKVVVTWAGSLRDGKAINAKDVTASTGDDHTKTNADTTAAPDKKAEASDIDKADGTTDAIVPVSAGAGDQG